MSDRAAALGQFYELMHALETRCRGKRRLAECDGRMAWPQLGVYFFFENGELRNDASMPRVVRVGTHALRPSRATLWSRLSQHRGSVGGSKPGGGNHRGSIFRLHVGTALLKTGRWPDTIQNSWGRGSSPPPGARDTEYPLERAVSTHIGAMPFLWLKVDDPPGPESDRGKIEAGSIALLSNHARPWVDPPSQDWLGRSADRQLVRDSGLWNVNHVQTAAGFTFLRTLEHYVR